LATLLNLARRAPKPRKQKEDAMTLPRRRFLQLAAGVAAMPVVSRAAGTHAYPARPVRLIVGYPAGGTYDMLARLTGQWLSERLNQPFVIENRPGAASNIATDTVVRAPADGYTLLLVGPAHAINATLYDKLSFDFIRDIVPVVGITREPLVLEVHPSFSARTVPEFIAYAKANPGKINIASPGNGSSGHVAGELFKMMTGTSMVHVPYRGAAPAITDLLGGQVQAYHERKPVGEVVARTAIELHLLAFLSGNDPEAVVFDLVQPRLAGRRLRGGCRKARRDEAPPAGRAKAVA
jgi:tripartite-type tricarboxylate transporter receptor subunit TctC